MSWLVWVAACADPTRVAPAPVDSATPEDRPGATLINVEAWVPSTAPDPLGEHRPDGAECGIGGVIREGATLEVDTGTCPYAFYGQPALVDVVAGDPITLTYWHSELVAEEPAEAHLAVLIDGALIYERYVAIPSPACAYTDVVTSDITAPVGAEVQLHLHNHGANAWNLLTVARAQPGVAEAWAEGCAN